MSAPTPKVVAVRSLTPAENFAAAGEPCGRSTVRENPIRSPLGLMTSAGPVTTARSRNLSPRATCAIHASRGPNGSTPTASTGWGRIRNRHARTPATTPAEAARAMLAGSRSSGRSHHPAAHTIAAMAPARGLVSRSTHRWASSPSSARFSRWSFVRTVAVDVFRTHTPAAMPRPSATVMPIRGRNDGARMRSLEAARMSAA
jgi:hypothetical protein